MFEYAWLDTLHCRRSRGTDFPSVGFHLHDQYEVYVFIGGDVRYFVEQRVYVLEPGDILLFNSGEIHKPTFPAPGVPYERCVLHFDPRAAQAVSPPSLRLLDCFEAHVGGEGNLLRPEPAESARVLALMEEIAAVQGGKAPGWEASVLARFLDLMLLLSRLSGLRRGDGPERGATLGGPLDEIVGYINGHLQDDLRLEQLEKRFYINKNYLCGLFRSRTGNTIHNYILHKRVALAKELLMQDHSVSEVCHLSGFGDYSNFIRSFRRVTGFSPARYRRAAEGGEGYLREKSASANRTEPMITAPPASSEGVTGS